jgi:hypothetical protein
MYSFGDKALENIAAAQDVKERRRHQHGYLEGLCNVEAFVLGVEEP